MLSRGSRSNAAGSAGSASPPYPRLKMIAKRPGRRSALAPAERPRPAVARVRGGPRALGLLLGRAPGLAHGGEHLVIVRHVLALAGALLTVELLLVVGEVMRMSGRARSVMASAWEA